MILLLFSRLRLVNLKPSESDPTLHSCLVFVSGLFVFAHYNRLKTNHIDN